MSAITIDGDLIHYEKLGKGRPVILVHGWLGSWRYWIPTMQQLHLKYTVYTLTMIGFGDSAKNPERYSMERQSQLVNTFLEQMGIPKAAFIGHGLGAMVVARFAQSHPDKVARMLLVSLPLFDPGDLKDRVPAGTRVLLTANRDRYSLAPKIQEIEDDTKKNREDTLRRNPLANLNTPPPTSPAVMLQKPVVKETELSDVTAGDKTEPTKALAVEQEEEFDDGKTVVSRVEANSPYHAPHEMPTFQSITPDERKRILEEASRSPIFSTPVLSMNNASNQLIDAFKGKTLLVLLEKCFKKTDPTYEKLKVDVEKADEKVLLTSILGYNAGKFLDDIRKITAPTVAVHGSDDPIIPAPNDEVWNYLTVEKDDMFVPIPLPNVRHFPMLEYEPFTRLATDFLEIAEISKLEVRGRWRRRSR
jgi:pimeloyl-ACP methyl ester carboxylesterase